MNKPFLTFVFISLLSFSNGIIEEENEARSYLKTMEKKYSEVCNKQATARWNYITNITDHTRKLHAEAQEKYTAFASQVQKDILEQFPNWRDFNDESVRRMLKYLSIQGPGTMPPENVAAMLDIRRNMQTHYSTAEVCGFNDSNRCNFRLDPEIENILGTSGNPQELAHYWTAWHDKMSELVPPSTYEQFIEFQHEKARANGFRDMTEYWMAAYDDGTSEWTAAKFKEQMIDLWEQIKPMYETLHAYVRMKLRQLPQYRDVVEKCGYIPVHLTGNMWAQEWIKLVDLTQPYQNMPSVDATDAMLRKMFRYADKFFTDLGLMPMPSTFWKKSMLERPNDGRKVVCHASAQDFCLGGTNTDFRIKQCTKVSMDQLLTAHHEMGHIEYYQQYKHQPYVFRDGANPGFHEAIGDALAMAVVTPKHLQCTVGLDLRLDSLCISNSGGITKIDINYLYRAALKNLAFFPSAISMEMWRWEAYEGKLTPERYNERWWELRKQIQGVSPANDRSSPYLFDPAAKYHIVANVEYLRYFISHILQYQFYEAMCIAAGQHDPKNPAVTPLFRCDFAGSKKAGKLLGDMMKLGFSKEWPVALEAITGQREISIDSLKKYFQPLVDYMTKELHKNGEVPGFGAGLC